MGLAERQSARAPPERQSAKPVRKSARAPDPRLALPIDGLVVGWPMAWAGMGWHGLAWAGMGAGMSWHGLVWAGMGCPRHEPACAGMGRRVPEHQSARAPERQCARAPECQSVRAPEHQSAIAQERQSGMPVRQNARAPGCIYSLGLRGFLSLRRAGGWKTSRELCSCLQCSREVHLLPTLVYSQIDA